MRQVGANGSVGGVHVVEEIHHPVCRDGVGHALHLEPAGLFAIDPVFDMGVGLVGNNNLTGRGGAFQAGGQIDAAADDRIVHAVIAAEIAHRAKVRMNAHAATQRFFHAAFTPISLQRHHAVAHGNGHSDTDQGVFPYAPALRIAKENYNGVAHIFIDGGAVFQGDLRHFG